MNYSILWLLACYYIVGDEEVGVPAGLWIGLNNSQQQLLLIYNYCKNSYILSSEQQG